MKLESVVKIFLKINSEYTRIVLIFRAIIAVVILFLFLIYIVIHIIIGFKNMID